MGPLFVWARLKSDIELLLCVCDVILEKLDTETSVFRRCSRFDNLKALNRIEILILQNLSIVYTTQKYAIMSHGRYHSQSKYLWLLFFLEKNIAWRKNINSAFLCLATLSPEILQIFTIFKRTPVSVVFRTNCWANIHAKHCCATVQSCFCN